MKEIDEKIDLIDGANDLFYNKTESIDNFLLNGLIKIYASFSTKDILEFDPIKAANLEKQIIEIIRKSDYKNTVKSYLRNFDAIGDMNKLVHEKLNDININALINENQKIKNFILLVEDQLTGTNKLAIRASQLDELVKPLASQIRKDLVLGNTFAEATKVMDELITTKKLGLNQWSQQIARDALTQSDRIMNDEVRKEYKMPYGNYIGGIKKTTRPICHHMVLVHSTFKWDEIQTIINPYVKNGVPNQSYTTETGRKMKKGSGIIEGTIAENFAVLAGGYGCEHNVTSSFKPPVE